MNEGWTGWLEVSNSASPDVDTYTAYHCTETLHFFTFYHKHLGTEIAPELNDRNMWGIYGV